MKITKRKGIYELSDFNIHIDRKTVLQMLDCHEDNPIFEEVNEEYEEIEAEIRELLEPKGLIRIVEFDEKLRKEAVKGECKGIYVLTTVGARVSSYSTQMFQRGDYLKGMLSDAMADSCLFSMEEQIQDTLREICAEIHMGINRRLEAPHDIPMDIQKSVHEQVLAQELLGIKITSGWMFDPVKTSCQVLMLTEDETMFRTQHDCRKCQATGCKMRRVRPVQVTVKEHDKCYTVECKEQESILSALIDHDTYFSAVCGGKGLCRKCSIRLMEGKLDITAPDKKAFTKKELADGWRLSCMAVPKEDCSISLRLNNESQFSIVSEYRTDCSDTDLQADRAVSSTDSQTDRADNSGRALQTDRAETSGNYAIAVDIGTTTLAFLLIDKQTGNQAASYAAINRQRAYGADVISRIFASNQGKAKKLQQCIREDLINGMTMLLQKAAVPPAFIVQVVISCNTTMGHLLMGYSCENLGVVPFTPVNIDIIKQTYAQIMDDDMLDCEMILLPGISTFVGGDIVSGMYACDFHKNQDLCLLVDLGTNGEMALGCKEKILVTSTAAGPAFEGGNITWGMGSVEGAISNVLLEGKSAVVKTIGEAPPTGLCGTGVIETTAELVRMEYVDETGLLDEECFENGFELAKTPEGESIVFTQKDVREIQLAKAAVRAGAETLLKRFGADYDSLKKVYLAGGFGFYLDIKKAVSIGMLPPELENKVKAVGNTSIYGAVRYIMNKNSDKDMEQIVSHSKEMNLSCDKEFHDFYMEHMFFE